MNENDKPADPKNQIKEVAIPATRKIAQIGKPFYGAHHEGKLYGFNPAKEDIENAINNNVLESRGFQSHWDELNAEWALAAKGNLDEFCRLQKEYHARRVAFFVVNGWDDPIELNENGTMKDGTHRLKAAIHKNMDEVKITVKKEV